MNSDYKRYQDFMIKITDIECANSVLSWDQEVYMPPKGASLRAQQISTLAGIAHELFTDDKFGNLLDSLNNNNSLSEKENKNVKETLRVYRDSKKYSTDFVITLNKTASEAYEAWHKAKQTNNFKIFAPFLEKLVDLKRKECEILGYEEHPYDALLNQYEPKLKTSDVDQLFEEVKYQLIPFVKAIAAQAQNNSSFLRKFYDRKKQWDFGMDLLKQMQYDFNSGRQDISAHPFTTSFGALDVRVTTRINENDIAEMVWSCIHEGGHALYEQGLNAVDYGLPSGKTISLGIHESQSRLWENNVGRSLAYWKANYPLLQKYFPENLKEVSLESFYKAINTVEPSLIRTAADELTYHFHILIRFEIEKALIEGSIEVKDLPSTWNKKYKDYLGIDVPSDDKGVLQDIHWSHGSFGYFPTYSIGSFYAAQFYAAAKSEIKDLGKAVENGNLKPLLDWLRKNIHQHGMLYSAEEICRRITGEKLNFKYFMSYAQEKYSHLYNLHSLKI